MVRQLTYPQVAFHALLQRAAERWPDAPAIRFEARSLTYAEWHDKAGRFASGLQHLGVHKGDRVALYLPNCPEYEIAFFGCARAGAIPTPLNPSYKEREVAYQLSDSGAVAAVTHASLSPILEAARRERALGSARSIVVGAGQGEDADFDAFLERYAASPTPVDLSGDDLAALPYSSGTTGFSKGVMLTQRNLVCNALQFVEATRSTRSDRLLIFLPLSHIYGVALMATAVASGAEQILMQRFDMETVLDAVQRHGITELYVVPPVMLALANAADLNPTQFRSLRFIMSAAAPLAAEVARRVADRLHVPVIQAYGMTESSPLTHMVDLDHWRDRLGSVGTVAADTRCRIVDLEGGGRELAIGEVGEVTVSGPQVMAGYWQDEVTSRLALRDGWLHTGDVGRVDDESSLHIVDRKKEMIKYKAFSIAPAELEAVLLEHPAVQDCAVVGMPDAEAGEVPRAFVVPKAEADVAAAVLQEFVAARVAGYKQLRHVAFVDAIPRTPSGKILRRVIREQERSLAT